MNVTQSMLYNTRYSVTHCITLNRSCDRPCVATADTNLTLSKSTCILIWKHKLIIPYTISMWYCKQSCKSKEAMNVSCHYNCLRFTSFNNNLYGKLTIVQRNKRPTIVIYAFRVYNYLNVMHHKMNKHN